MENNNTKLSTEENYSKQYANIIKSKYGSPFFLHLLKAPGYFGLLTFIIKIYLILRLRCPMCNKRFPLWWLPASAGSLPVYRRCPRCGVILNEKGIEQSDNEIGHYHYRNELLWTLSIMISVIIFGLLVWIIFY